MRSSSFFGSLLLVAVCLTAPRAAAQARKAAPTAAATRPKPTPASAPGTVTVQGQIRHAPEPKLYLGAPSSPPAEVKLSPDGRFKLTLPWPVARPAKLVNADQQTALWLTPGDNLTLNLDYNDFDVTLRYTGRGATVNQYLAADMLAEQALDERIGASYSTAPARFTAFTDSLRAVRLARLTQAFPPSATVANRAFLDWQRATYAFGWGAARLWYPNAWARQNPAKRLAANDPYYAFLRDPALDLTQPPPAEVAPYRKFVPEARRVVLEQQGVPATDVAVYRALRTDRALPADQVGLIISSVAREALQNPATTSAEADSLHRWADADARIPADNRKILDQMWQLLQMTRPGLPAPELTAVMLDGKPFTWAAVRGKVVYLDFWASWCGPCRAEMPAAGKLHEALHDRAADVVFLNVSVDVNADNWRKAIESSHVDGLNVHSPGDAQWSSPALKAYGINGIPRYLLIGPDGRILNGNAPRPGEAEATIRAALAGGTATPGTAH